MTVAILLLVATVFAAASSASSSPITKAVSFVTAPLGKVASYFAEKADSFTGGFVSSESYRKRVEELESEVAEYRAELVDYENAKKQLNSYEEFLDVREENPDFEWVYCTVIGRDSADVFSSFTLNKGSNHGIKVNDAVIRWTTQRTFLPLTTPSRIFFLKFTGKNFRRVFITPFIR